MGVIDAAEIDRLLVNPLKKRIRQLEKQCEVLAAEVDRMRPVVEAAAKTTGSYSDLRQLRQVVHDYQASNPK